MRGIYFIAAAMLCSVIAHAGIWGSDDLLPWSDPSVPAKPVEVKQPMFQSVSLGSVLIIFEKTTLAEVRAKLGAGEVQHQGDAAGSYYWLCYRLADGSALGIFSNGEMGGPDHAVTDIEHRAEAGEKGALCPLLQTTSTVASDTGLGLGAAEAAFVKRLGPPGGRAADRASWLFDRSGKGRGGEWTTDQWIDVQFRGGCAAVIVFGQETSY